MAGVAVLEAAQLVTTVRRGREKLHYLNPAPISDVAERWISRYDRRRVIALSALKHALEEDTMDAPSFVYTTYIGTTPERLWRALTFTPEWRERAHELVGFPDDFLDQGWPHILSNLKTLLETDEVLPQAAAPDASATA